jgi:AcrR family transcriptional regulator
MSPKTTRKTKSKLDHEAVTDAASRLADEEGLDSVSFRRLADQFAVTPMALYWHFEDKEALLAALADRLWLQAADTLSSSLEQLSSSEDDGWGQLRLTLIALVDAMRPHPAIAELVPTRVLDCEAGREVTELTLGFLARHGFDPRQSSDLGRFVLSSAVMLVSTPASALACSPSCIEPEVSSTITTSGTRRSSRGMTTSGVRWARRADNAGLRGGDPPPDLGGRDPHRPRLAL